jgi:hypothetical protein
MGSNKALELDALQIKVRQVMPPSELIAQAKIYMTQGEFAIAYYHWLFFLTNGRQLLKDELKDVTVLMDQCMEHLRKSL